MSDVRDRIDVVDVEIPCIIGIHPEERSTAQPLLVSLSFTLDTRKAAHDGALHATVDYARVLGVVGFVLVQGRFLLIETAAELVAAAVLATVDVVDEVTVTIKKPRALGGNGTPQLTIHRLRDTSAGRWTFPFGVVDVVHVLPASAGGFGLYALSLQARRAVALPKDVHVLRVDTNRQGDDLGTPRRLEADAGVARYVLIARPSLPLDAFVVA
ncbi:MAG TPA: dihydroneopterin aldolase [Myxococcota bacterium]